MHTVTALILFLHKIWNNTTKMLNASTNKNFRSVSTTQTDAPMLSNTHTCANKHSHVITETLIHVKEH